MACSMGSAVRRQVTVRPDSIRVTRSIILYTWGREIPEDAIAAFEPYTNLKVNGQPRYVIRAKLHSGKNVTVGSGFRSKGQAQLAIQKMIEMLAQSY